MGLYGHRNHLSLIQLMEDPKMHKKEKKLLNKTPDVSFHSYTPWGVDHEIHNICPLSPFDATHQFYQN